MFLTKFPTYFSALKQESLHFSNRTDSWKPHLQKSLFIKRKYQKLTCCQCNFQQNQKTRQQNNSSQFCHAERCFHHWYVIHINNFHFLSGFLPLHTLAAVFFSLSRQRSAEIGLSEMWVHRRVLSLSARDSPIYDVISGVDTPRTMRNLSLLKNWCHKAPRGLLSACFFLQVVSYSLSPAKVLR